MKLTNEEVETKLLQARREDGTYDSAIVSELNQKGVTFKITPHGISYQIKD